MSDSVQTKIHESVGTIVLNRPEKRNALTRRLLADLSQAFFDLHAQKSVRAVVVTGAGSAFCAGMDLDEMRAAAEEEEAQAIWRQDAHQYEEVIETMLRFPKPLIAAVNGPAAAGGVGLMLACDMVVGSDEATIS
ncbi:MAG: enoyl-CoA hydratase/isomerase family protein, partial [bacterium]|nr:enoyl-CoA hydratase/isomerase family protein [bacterium]